MKTREQVVRKYRAEVLRDLRNQIKWITEAIATDDQSWIDTYADQLSASALNLRSDVMEDSLQLNKENA